MTDKIFKEELLNDEQLDEVAGGTIATNFNAIEDTVSLSWRPPGRIKGQFVPPAK